MAASDKAIVLALILAIGLVVSEAAYLNMRSSPSPKPQKREPLIILPPPENVTTQIVVFEDGGVAFWETGGAAESNDAVEKKSGVDSYKLVLQNGVVFNSVHGMASQDYSTELNVEFWIYGADISDDADVWLRFMNYAQADEYYYTIITLNFTGWRHYSVPRADFLMNYVPSGWNDIEMVEFYAFFAGNSETIRIDLLTITSPM